MGSFDDAIRQHLDLKRKRGADPREVAHLEREALGIDPEAQGTAPRSPTTPFDGATFAAGGDVVDWSDGNRLKARRTRLSEETVEIDMKAFMEAEGSRGERHELHAYDWSADMRSPDIADPASSFEWETPQRARLRGAA